MTKSKSLIEKQSKLIICLFFILFFAIGLIIFKDYGISWDERRSRTNGLVNLKYVIKKDPLLLSYEDKYYGPVFEIFLVAIEKVFNLTENTRAVYLMRHLATFLCFYLGVIFFYHLTKNHFNSWKIGLLGSLFLILSPRIFSHSFYNSKDLPFLAIFIISIYTLTKFLDRKSLANAILHALVCAFLIDIRILGIIVPAITALFFIPHLLKKNFSSFLFYFFLLVVLTILFWPILWTNPLYHFLEAFRQMSSFSWQRTVLYLGNYLEAGNLPWYYIPVWLAISTPIIYTLFFLIGFFITAKPSKNKKNDLIFTLWFILPLAAVVLLRSVLYDSWRQMFFIYPAFLIISLKGLVFIFKKTNSRIKAIILLTIFLSFFKTFHFIVKNHPYQNLYFNRIAGKTMEEVKNNFELDYWGLSYRQGLEYILKNDQSEKISVYVPNEPGKNNADILPEKDRQRLVYVESPDKAKYFLSNYRWHKEEYSYKNEFYSIKVGGAKIMVVYKLH